MEPAARQPRHGTCGAKTRTGGNCGKPAGWGTPSQTGRCKLHGGATPSHRKQAEKQQAAQAVATYGLPVDTEPHQALLDELHRTAGHVAWLAVIVAELKKDELHGPVGGGQGGIPEEKPHIWVVLYQQERKHLTAVAKTCIDVGIEERRVRVVEQWGEGLAQYTKTLLERLQVPLDAPATREAVKASMTLVQGGGQAA